MATSIASIQSNEVGKQLSFTQTSSAPNFTGATVSLLVTSPTNVETSFSCSVVSSVPTYTTTGTEFPTAGKYSIQLKFVNGATKYYSSVATLTVLPNLA